MVTLVIGAIGLSFGIMETKAADQPAGGTVYRKALVVGDSITSHAPAEQLGWTGSWGMAASSQDKDYPHLFLARLAQAQNGVVPEAIIGGGGGGKLTSKLTELEKYKAFAPDLAIIQMGENDNTDVTVEGFQKPYEQILEAIRAGNPKAKILCLGVWGPPSGNAHKDGMIQDACKKFDATFVSLQAANEDPLNRAEAEKRFTHQGVNWHPGDKGMQAYADALWAAFTGKATGQTVKAAAEVPITLFVEKWDGVSGVKWDVKPNIEKTDGKQVLAVKSTDPDKQVFFNVNLPVEKIKGRTLVLETLVKGDSISEKPKKWNGIRIGLQTTNAEGQLAYPQLHLKDGTFDWTDAKWFYRVPDNIVSAKLQIGLENVTGTVYFDALKLSLQ